MTSRVPNADAEINPSYAGFVNFQIRGMGIRGLSLSNDPNCGVLIDSINKGKPTAPKADECGELDQQAFRGALIWRVTDTLVATNVYMPRSYGMEVTYQF